jgi:hypothetical protein
MSLTFSPSYGPGGGVDRTRGEAVGPAGLVDGAAAIGVGAGDAAGDVEVAPAQAASTTAAMTRARIGFQPRRASDPDMASSWVGRDGAAPRRGREGWSEVGQRCGAVGVNPLKEAAAAR